MIADAVQVNPQAQITLGADKGYDAGEFVAELQRLKVQPHVAQTPGYSQSIRCRKRIEQGFGWAKTIGQIRQVMVRGLKKVEQLFVLNMATYMPGAHALAGANPSAGGKMSGKEPRNGLQKARIIIIPAMSGSTRVSVGGTFQQPVSVTRVNIYLFRHAPRHSLSTSSSGK